MELRVLGAAGAVLEARDYQIAGGLATDRAAGADAGGGHMSLDMGHRGPDRFAMCDNQSPVARDLGHDRNRLGSAQRHVPAGPMLKPAVAEGAKLLDRKSVVSGQSVSVRVALGGRRNIHKKKYKKNYTQ